MTEQKRGNDHRETSMPEYGAGRREEAGKSDVCPASSPSLNIKDGTVLALPRGGVPVGYEVACRCAMPLDVLVVRKLGVPGQPELAMGAIASSGTQAVNRELMEELGLAQETLDSVVDRELLELNRQDREFCGGRLPVKVAGRLFWSMTGWQPGPACALPSCRSARELRGWWLQSPLEQTTHAVKCTKKQMSWSAPPRENHSAQWEGSIAISSRSPMTKSGNYCSKRIVNTKFTMLPSQPIRQSHLAGASISKRRHHHLRRTGRRD
jgi:hypothetical protein